MVSDFSIDEFLGGRLKIKQPLRGYRAGVDPVLLAASVNAYEGEDILDLGCGWGSQVCAFPAYFWIEYLWD